MWFKRKPPKKPHELFLYYMKKEQFEEALPVIRDIVSQAPGVLVSHFNLGICLEKLGQNREAADAFLHVWHKAQDGAALYHACIALAKDGDGDALFAVFYRTLLGHPEMIDEFVEEEAFALYFKEDDFRKLAEKYGRFFEEDE
jgi:tetratricopeptide (TPR) repeat protein